MKESNNYINFFSGSEVEILRVKDLLENENIPSIVQNDHHSGNLGGFFGGTPSTVRLMVRELDFDKARILIENQQAS